MRLGLIGTGFMGKTHAAAHLAAGVVDELHALTVTDDLAAKFKEEFPGAASVGTEADTFFALGLDAIDICTPTPTHADLVRRGLATGHHILCEKPLTLERDSSMTLAREAEAARRSLMVAQVIRFWPEYERLRQIADSGELGRLVSVRLERYSPLPRWGDWFANLSESGGALFDLHVHDVDFVQHAFGMPESLGAMGRKERDAAYLDIDTTMRLPGGAVASVYASYDQPASVPFRMQYRALFEKGAVDYDVWRQPSLRIYRDTGTEDVDLSDQPNGYENECRYFGECVAAGRQPERATAPSAAQTIGLLQTIGESADAGGKLIHISEGESS